MTVKPLVRMPKSKTSSTGVEDVFVEVYNFSRIHRFAGLSALTYTRGRFRISIKWLIANLIIISCVLIINLNTIFTTRKVCWIVCAHLLKRKVPDIDTMVDREPDNHQHHIDYKLADHFYYPEVDVVSMLTILLLEHRPIVQLCLRRRSTFHRKQPEDQPPQQMPLQY
ncbi:unnamed protein product [Nezara viridula]|uniref:Uncharacterized protein n=1 Tax=Nezara viridula TaxID=85310 RepID=A0A9P0EC83_NEZVI|nr:unnamed protein product [Nezara viridula]